LQTENDDALLQSMRDICGRRSNLKHCPELIPMPVSQALVTASVAQDYQHLFLYRCDPIPRILSLEYAQRTNAWGPGQTPQGDSADSSTAFDAALDIKAILTHEATAHTRLNQSWQALLEAGVSPIALSFEELYLATPDNARQSLIYMLAGLDMVLPAEQIDTLLQRLRGTGNQNTRNRYDQFRQIDQLKQRIGDLPQLIFHSDPAPA